MKKIKSKNILLDMGLTKQNLIIFIVGLISILIGYLALAVGDTYDTLSLVVGPIFLAIGYVVVIPVAILYRTKSDH